MLTTFHERVTDCNNSWRFVWGRGVRPVLRSERLAESVCHYVTHDAHHSQTHSQHRTLIRDMLPQHPVNIKELICECF